MTTALPPVGSTTPLTDHLHEVALEQKRAFSTFVQELLLQQDGHAARRLQLDNQQWHDTGMPGLSVRHIERHPNDPDNFLLGRRGTGENCGSTLPHLSVFSAHPTLKGTLITQYHSRVSCISGALLLNDTLVTSHDRTLNEFFTSPGEAVKIEVLEMSYVMVKYFASADTVGVAERGPTLPQLARRHQQRYDWFTIYPDEGEPTLSVA